ncbi:MAG: metallophosphoesterase [Nitrososphaerota archaeon]|nr:metallophosphoesterase [Nitrososphaerota archaeon]
MTDIHGSDKCFRKFINAAKFYKAQSLVLGGDITGKVMIPVVDQGNGRWVADYLGDKLEFSKQENIQEFGKNLAEGGIYTITITKSEYDEMQASKDRIDEAFAKSMQSSLERWLSLASERLKGTGTKCYISIGNDDELIVDDVLRSKATESVLFCEEEIIDIGGHEMISLGTSNRTPWNSPREADEPVLKEKLDAMAGKLSHPENSIFSVHVPPFDSGIDAAPQIDENFKVVIKGGQPIMIPVGSTAVREAINQYKPLVGLHGHIHESRGIYKLGKTVCINPGSEYAQGILRGAIVDLEDNKLADYLLVSG